MSQSTTASRRFSWGMPLWQQILIGLVLGVVVGLLFKDGAKLLAPLGALSVSYTHLTLPTTPYV